MPLTKARSARALILLLILLLPASTCLFAQQSSPQPSLHPSLQPIQAHPPMTRIISNAGDHLARLQKLSARIMQRISAASNNTNQGQRITVTSHHSSIAHAMPGKSPAGMHHNPVVVTGTFSMSLVPTNTTCGYSNGSIVASVTGGTPPYSYSRSPNPPQSNGWFSNLSAGTYNISATDAGGLTASQSITLTNTYAPPTLSIVSSTPVTGCTGTNATVTLNASGGTPPYAYSIDGANFQGSNVISNLSAGDYLVFVRDANGCIDTLPFISNINSLNCNLSISIGYTQEVCQHEGTLEITNVYGGSPPYTYSINSKPYQTSNIFTGLSAGLVTISIKDVSGNLIFIYTIGLYELCPVYISAVATDADCAVDNGTITATGSSGTPPYAYAYVPGQQTTPGAGPFQASPVFSNLSSGDYTVTIMDFDGVKNFATVTVGGGCPSVSAASVNSTCGLNNGSITATGSGGFPSYQYALYQNATVIVPFQSSNTFPNLAPGNYTVYIQDNKSVQRSTNAAVTATPDPLTISAGGPGPTICEGNSFQLSGTTNGTNYFWSPATGLSDPGILNPIAAPQTTTKYYLRSLLNTCTAIDSVTINVLPAPVADAGKDTAICLGTSVQLSGSGGGNYSWTPTTWLDDPDISNPISLHPNRTVIYSLTVMDGNGCMSLNPSSVKITVQPGFISAGNDTSIAIGQPLQLFALDPSNNATSQYIWTPSTDLDNPYINTPIATFGETGVYTYTVNATALDGCESQGKIVITVYRAPDIFIPTAFTPNGDGHNDILKVIPAGIKTFKYMAIFSRWGQKVFYTTNLSQGWDGTFSGTTQQSGTYIWMAEAIDYTGHTIQRTGSVILIR